MKKSTPGTIDAIFDSKSTSRLTSPLIPSLSAPPISSARASETSLSPNSEPIGLVIFARMSITLSSPARDEKNSHASRTAKKQNRDKSPIVRTTHSIVRTTLTILCGTPIFCEINLTAGRRKNAAAHEMINGSNATKRYLKKRNATIPIPKAVIVR